MITAKTMTAGLAVKAAVAAVFTLSAVTGNAGLRSSGRATPDDIRMQGALGAAHKPAEATVVLDTLSVWRMHSQLAPPVLSTGGPAPFTCRWMSCETPAPAQDWMKPDYDDRFWNRGPLMLVPKTALLGRTCLRGKFTVTDAAAVKGLLLSTTYNGGIIVYVNGQEVHREHIAVGQALADGTGGEERTLADCEIPAATLHMGINVIGLEFVRASYPKEGTEIGADVYNVNTCEVKKVRLTAAGEAGLAPNVGRPAGMQVWPADPLALDMSLDYGDRTEPLRPVTIVSTLNGMSSGKVVVGSSRPIRALKATAGNLVGPGGVIPASAVRIRYGVEWGEQLPRETSRLNHPMMYIRADGRLDATQFNALAPVAPEEVAVRPSQGAWHREANLPEAVMPAPGALAPVWLTVKVPANVKAGQYTGVVKIEAQEEKPVEVPVEVRVTDWKAPDTQDYRTWVDLIECPDTLALEYNIPLWSEKHWEMIANSFKLIGETGCRIVYVPLIAHTNLGNEESMVRWVKKGENKYDYDFSIMERYLDVAEKNMGKPKAIVFVVWDVYMLPKSADENPHGIKSRLQSELQNLEKVGGKFGQGPLVTMLDPATRKTELLTLPTHFETAASKPLWQPLFDELRKRLAQRKLEKTALLGLMMDAWATKKEVQFFQEITGGMPWALQSHEGLAEGAAMYGITPVNYEAVVWNVKFSDDGADDHGKGQGLIDSLHGWNRNVLWSQFERFSRESHPCTRYLQQAEVCITGAQRGPGRLGAEYWNVLRDKNGKRKGRSPERYPESNWRNLIIPEALLAPGPGGAVATNQMEALREGVQDCEALIVIEQALMDEARLARLGAELAQRCQEYLRARHMLLWLSLSDLQFYGQAPGAPGCYARGWRVYPNVTGHNWFLSSGYQERRAELFTLAGEVTRKLGGP